MMISTKNSSKESQLKNAPDEAPSRKPQNLENLADILRFMVTTLQTKRKAEEEKSNLFPESYRLRGGSSLNPPNQVMGFQTMMPSTATMPFQPYPPNTPNVPYHCCPVLMYSPLPQSCAPAPTIYLTLPHILSSEKSEVPKKATSKTSLKKPSLHEILNSGPYAKSPKTPSTEYRSLPHRLEPKAPQGQIPKINIEDASSHKIHLPPVKASNIEHNKPPDPADNVNIEVDIVPSSYKFMPPAGAGRVRYPDSLIAHGSHSLKDVSQLGSAKHESEEIPSQFIHSNLSEDDYSPIAAGSILNSIGKKMVNLLKETKDHHLEKKHNIRAAKAIRDMKDKPEMEEMYKLHKREALKHLKAADSAFKKFEEIAATNPKFRKNDPHNPPHRLDASSLVTNQNIGVPAFQSSAVPPPHRLDTSSLVTSQNIGAPAFQSSGIQPPHGHTPSSLKPSPNIRTPAFPFAALQAKQQPTKSDDFRSLQQSQIRPNSPASFHKNYSSLKPEDTVYKQLVPKGKVPNEEGKRLLTYIKNFQRHRRDALQHLLFGDKINRHINANEDSRLLPELVKLYKHHKDEASKHLKAAQEFHDQAEEMLGEDEDDGDKDLSVFVDNDPADISQKSAPVRMYLPSSRSLMEIMKNTV